MYSSGDISGGSFISYSYTMLVRKAYADISGSDFGVTDKLGNIDGFRGMFIFMFNLFYWLGLCAAGIGIMYTFVYITYNMMFKDDGQEAYEVFSEGIKRFLYVAILALLLLSLGFGTAFVGRLIGLNIPIKFLHYAGT